MAERKWKVAERRVAAVFGAKRTGPTGKDDSDVIHPLLAIEVKYRAGLPAWALECLQQARTGRTAGGKTPITILLAKQMNVRDGLVVMTVREFEELWGPFNKAKT